MVVCCCGITRNCFFEGYVGTLHTLFFGNVDDIAQQPISTSRIVIFVHFLFLLGRQVLDWGICTEPSRAMAAEESRTRLSIFGNFSCVAIDLNPSFSLIE